MTEKITLTIREMAELLGISLPTAYALARSDDFPTLHIGRKLLVNREGLKQWLDHKTKG